MIKEIRVNLTVLPNKNALSIGAAPLVDNEGLSLLLLLHVDGTLGPSPIFLEETSRAPSGTTP